MNKYNHRERVKTAFEHKEADRVTLTELLISPHIIDYILGEGQNIFF